MLVAASVGGASVGAASVGAASVGNSGAGEAVAGLVCVGSAVGPGRQAANMSETANITKALFNMTVFPSGRKVYQIQNALYLPNVPHRE
jgi:hypothetical protein